MSSTAIEVRGAVKVFGAQRALNDVSVGFVRGSVHALVGLNGSGKSTLVKVLAGVYSLDGGQVLVDGEEVTDLTPARAGHLGLQFLHQDPVVFGTLTVADNVALGSGYRHSRATHVRTRAESATTRTILERLNVTGIDPDVPLHNLSPAQRTMVAIARAVQDMWSERGVRLLVLDEPTASLPEHEVGLVTGLVRRVAAAGVAVIYITHDLGMALELASTVTVLRDGRVVTTAPTSTMSKQQLAAAMVGTAPDDVPVAPRLPVRRSESVMFRAHQVSGGTVKNLSLDVRKGEIVGVAGLLGSGRSTLLRLIYGAQARTGTVELDGRPLPPGNPRVARRAGVGFVPEDRRRHGAFPQMAMVDNITVASLSGVAGRFWVGRRAERRSAVDTMDEFDVQPRDPARQFRLFSGGNQQKAIIGRWARIGPTLMLLDEPTQGVDVHARQQIHASIRRMAADGMSAIVVSSDFGELLELTDRVVVMRRGRLHREVDPTRTAEDELLHLCATDEPQTRAEEPR